MCNGDYAAVLVEYGSASNIRAILCRCMMDNVAVVRGSPANMTLRSGVNMFTFTHGQAHTGSQNPSAPATGKPEPASGPGLRSAVPDVGLFRRPRPGAGQVRDGPPRARGWTRGQPERGGVWLLAPIVLSRAGAARPWRVGRARAAETRSPSFAQARCGRDGVHRATAVRRRGPAPGGLGRSNPETVSARGPSTEHRTGVGATGKKRR